MKLFTLIFLGFLILGWNSIAFSQPYREKLDSFLKEEKTGHYQGEKKVDLFNNIAKSAIGYEPELNLEYASKALEYSKELSYLKGMCDSYHNIGSYYYYKSEYDSSLYFNQKALKIAIDNDLKELEARSYNNIAVDYDDLGKLDKVIEYTMKCLKVNEEIGDLDGMASANTSLGSVYFQQGQYEQAINHFKKALEYDFQADYKSGIAYDYANLGAAYYKLEQADSSLYYLRKAEVLKKELKDLGNLSLNHINMANIFHDIGQMDSAITHLNQAKEILEETGDRDALSHLYTSMAQMQTDHFKNYSLAEKQALKALEIAKEIKFLYREIESIQILTKVYELKGDYRNAVKFWKKYSSKHDSLVNTKNAQILDDLKSKHKEEKHQLELSNLRKQQEVADKLHESELQAEQLRSSNRQRIIYFLVIGLILVAFLGFIAFRNFQAKKKAHFEIQLQKEIVEEKNHEILDSISYAKRIQSAILPPDKLIKEHLPNSFVLYKPKDIVAGDFYWLELSKSKSIEQESMILLSAADCTGHGVPGAMVSVVCNNGLNRSVREFGLTDPGKILDKTRELVIEEFEKSDSSSSYAEASADEIKDGMDIALVALAQSELESVPIAIGSEEGNPHSHTAHSLSFSGAHNPLWIIRKGSNEIEEIKANKQPIGKFVDPKPYTTHDLELNSGDTFYIFSDGYADQFGGESGKKLKSKNFKRKLIEIQHLEMEEQRAELDRFFEEWRGKHEQIDDVCVIGVRI